MTAPRSGEFLRKYYCLDFEPMMLLPRNEREHNQGLSVTEAQGLLVGDVINIGLLFMMATHSRDSFRTGPAWRHIRKAGWGLHAPGAASPKPKFFHWPRRSPPIST